jgi:2-oxoglutarate dehydrogenase E1 component
MSTTPSDLTSFNLGFAEDLYLRYQSDPFSVPEDWQVYFKECGNGSHPSHPPLAEAARACKGVHVDQPEPGPKCTICGREEQMSALQQRVDKLINSYRMRGHRIACIDPLGQPLPELPELDPAYYGLTLEDPRLYAAGMLAPGKMLSLGEILDGLRETYCRSIGVQFMHIDDLAVREWLQTRMEASRNHIAMSRDRQIRILAKLTDAVIIEEFIQNKFIGSKRFSLEGAESLIPLLDLAIEEAGQQGIEEMVIGMAHRGRLNVLANVMGKRPQLIFREFEDKNAEAYIGKGDVKYHMGYHNDYVTSAGHELHLALCFNPSHLELVNPVALGRVRAKQDRLGDTDRGRYMTLLIHGDAAFAGEGVVQETLNMSQLEGYRTGGTLHVIINNQIGFTTVANDGRSGVYASDIAKMLQIPIFHVNGEDPESVAQAVALGMEFRKTFRRDVVIDMMCYRRHGHNEGDEPSFTQPVMYRQIAARPSVRESYLRHLLKLGEMTQEEADKVAESRRQELEEELSAAREGRAPTRMMKGAGRSSILGRLWKEYRGGPDDETPEADTSVPAERLSELLRKLTDVPDGFHVHPKLQRIHAQRLEMANGKRSLDWAAAEALAFATLVTGGARIRLSGQDARRGTFSHRHAFLHDYENGTPHCPLQHLEPGQAPFEVWNSPLSEVGVLGFDYGYSIACPDALVIWEAQFGDFANCAQALIDQGITSAEDKWNSLSGLVLLLPHGFEGMGPEHSSARLERYLMLAAEDNIQIANPSTPAQFFHLLRRQVVRPYRKPLFVMTPKSLLRHPRVVSPLEAFTSGGFRRILPDSLPAGRPVSRVLLCSGKVYYDLIEERERLEREDVAILRFEQLYPLQDDRIRKALAGYPAKTDVVWVQEEPENMGAWPCLRIRFCGKLAGKWRLRGVSRAASASPATGSASSHRLEQRKLIDEAFADLP